MRHRLVPSRHRRGFTLIEAVMAAGILLVVVVAVTAAVTAGQQHAYEAQQRIAASLAAEELMGRLAVIDYDDLDSWNGHVEGVGAMLNMSSKPMPDSMSMIGRDVTVTDNSQALAALGVKVVGKTIRVRCFEGGGRTLADLSVFVSEPVK